MMKDSPTENPKRKKIAVLKAAILGAVIYGGITLAFIWWASHGNYEFGSISLVGLVVSFPSFIVSDFINFISKFLGFARFADSLTETQTFCVIINALFGALIGYWFGCETRNRKRS
jgi:uncharacterized protein (DUF2062 family)